MHQLSVTAVGKDHPGIVAAITQVLYELGCNLDDCSMSLLSGQFSMIMVLDAPESVSAHQLDQALESAAREAGVQVSVAPVAPAESAPVVHPYVVSVYGADHPGIVYKVTAELFAHGVNITDLQSRVLGEQLYTVVLDVDVPHEYELDRLAQGLQRVAEEEGIDLRLRPADLETL